MRSLLWIAAVGMLFAGCLDDTEPTQDASPEEEIETSMDAPQAFEHTGAVVAGVSPGPMVAGNTGGKWCDFGCEEIPFTLNTTASVTVVLSWGLDANDFDLVLMDAEGNEIATSGASPPSTTEQVASSLEPGDYVIGVVPFAVTMDDYTVSVTFA